jgi:hypothetical protein
MKKEKSKSEYSSLIQWDREREKNEIIKKKIIKPEYSSLILDIPMRQKEREEWKNEKEKEEREEWKNEKGKD